MQVIVYDKDGNHIITYPIITNLDHIEAAKENLIEDGYATPNNIREFTFKIVQAE